MMPTTIYWDNEEDEVSANPLLSKIRGFWRSKARQEAGQRGFQGHQAQQQDPPLKRRSGRLAG
jgi:hypothetical protein